jgi:hypothetical protein
VQQIIFGGRFSGCVKIPLVTVDSVTLLVVIVVVVVVVVVVVLQAVLLIKVKMRCTTWFHMFSFLLHNRLLL